MKLVDSDEALAAIASHGSIVAAPGCATPTTLLRAIGDGAGRLEAGTTLYSGLLLGDYPFVDAVRDGRLRYATWHVMPAVRRLVAEGVVGFIPVRGSQVPAMLRELDVEVVLLRVSPPDRFGFCSTGPSGSFPLLAIEHADLVVAEIDQELPRVRGQAAVHESRIDLGVWSEDPTPVFPGSGEPDEVSRQIARHVMDLLPPKPTLQIGIGAIPEALLDELRAAGATGLRFAGMATDAMVDLHKEGLLDVEGLWPIPPIFAAELMGSRRLLDFAHENPLLGVFDTNAGIHPRLGDIDRFVSIQSAIAVDLEGQVNAEWVKGAELSGCGGSIDFLEAAILSEGGVRILAMPASTARDASTKIVRDLGDGAPVTVARHSIDFVVTEYGIARLGYLSIAERAEALAAVAPPEARSELVGEGAAA